MEVHSRNGSRVHNTRFAKTPIVQGIEMKHTFTVTGMTCEHCEKAVVRVVRQLDQSAEVSADRTNNKVEVTSEQSRDALAKAIADEGYVVAA
jgi:copper chaperone